MRKCLTMLCLFLAVTLLAGCTASAIPEPQLAEPDPTPVATQPSAPDQTESTLPPETTVPPSQPSTEPAPTSLLLSREEATAIALDHAGFTADQVSRLECELDKERWGMEYEIDFHQGNYEYNYDIHGETGEILYWEKEVDD